MITGRKSRYKLENVSYEMKCRDQNRRAAQEMYRFSNLILRFLVEKRGMGGFFIRDGGYQLLNSNEAEI